MSQIQAIHSLLSSIKNGSNNRLSIVKMKYSKLCHDIINILYEEGYILDFKITKELHGIESIEVTLKYYNNVSAIKHLERVSKNNITLPLLNYIDLGLVTYILSTPLGIISGKEARRLGVGGIILVVVW